MSLPIIALGGCASNQMAKMNVDDAMMAGQPEAALTLITEVESRVGRNERMLLQLDKGRLLAQTSDPQNWRASNAAFAEARNLIELADAAAAVSLTGSAAEMFANPNVQPYSAKTSDRLLTHFYPAINYLRLGDIDSFRVEVRAMRDAHEQIANIQARQIALAEAQIAKAKQEAAANNSTQAISPEDTQNSIFNAPEVQKAYAHIHAISPERIARHAYESAAIHFLDGLVNALTLRPGQDDDDLDSTFIALANAMAMAPDVRTVQNCNRELEKLRTDFVTKPRVWVIHENGLGPVIREFRVAVAFAVPSEEQFIQQLVVGMMKADLVLPIPVKNPLFNQALFSFPVMEPRNPNLFYDSINIATTEHGSRATQLVSSVEEQQLLHFKSNLGRTMTAAVVGGMVKATAAQLIVNEAKGNPLASLALGGLMSGLTKADQRLWASLPREFRLACVDSPSDGQITLSAARGLLAHQPMVVNVPSDSPSLVYISTPANSSVPVVSVLQFQRIGNQTVVSRFPQPYEIPDAEQLSELIDSKKTVGMK